MKLTHQAAAHASALIRRKNEGAFDKAFTKYPELYRSDFWEMVMVRAGKPATAQMVIDALTEMGREGATYSPKIASQIEEAMLAARRTLRYDELSRWNLQKR